MATRSLNALAAPLALLLLATTGAVSTRAAATDPITVRSPDNTLSLTFHLSDAGLPLYRVTFHNHPVLSDSPLNLTFQTGGPLTRLELTDTRRDTHDETYPIVAGKSSSARNHYNEATLSLRETSDPHRRIDLTFRAYDDGVAFRYHIPDQTPLHTFAIASENSTFSLPSGATAWVLPMPHHAGHYEYLYQPQKVSDLSPGQLIGPPLLVELPDNGPALAITEANLTDYAGMCLQVPPAGQPSNLLHTSLTPRLDDKTIAVKATAPHDSPWRVILLADTAGKLIESNLIMNLNDPCALPDTSWIHPGKVAFLWWNGYLVGRNGKRGGVNTATFNHYVDGAAELGFPYSSIDGLDVAWYGGKIPGYGQNDITVPVKDLDIQAVLAHAKSKHVRIRLWVASQGLRNYLDKALDTYERWGVEGIMVDFIERDDQDEVNWLREMVAKAAQHHLTVTLHNVPKPTGLSRTYPNLLTREAVRNQEYDKWDPVGVTPEHNLTVPFTRMLAGPLDYHAGAFRSVRKADFLPRDVAPDVMGTRCQQLAMYVVYDDPMPMAVDYPAAYRNRPGIDFLSSVPTTWDETRFLQGQVGQYIALARRKGTTWYVGSMTDSTPRTLQIPLTFLPPGTYTAESWSDDPANGPNALLHTTRPNLTPQDTLPAPLAPAGGQVLRLTPTPPFP